MMHEWGCSLLPAKHKWWCARLVSEKTEFDSPRWLEVTSGRSLVGLKRYPVTVEIAGSNPVALARSLGDSSNGKTAASKPADMGSIPISPVVVWCN
jgi:hypothetical protein